MSERPYSRVYHEIVEDERFREVYGDDAALATWLRLLIIADAAYPTAAPIPRSCKDVPLSRLVDAGLVEMVGEDVFRIHGLVAERERRSKQASEAANTRWHGADHAPVMRQHADADATAMLDEPSKDKQRRDEQDAREEPDAAVAYHRITGRFPSEPVLQWLNQMSRDHPEEAVVRTLAAQFAQDHTLGTLLSRTDSALKLAAHERAKQEERARHAAATRASAAAKEREASATAEERERASVIRRAVALWMKQRPAEPVPTDTEELRTWLQQQAT